MALNFSLGKTSSLQDQQKQRLEFEVISNQLHNFKMIEGRDLTMIIMDFGNLDLCGNSSSNHCPKM